MKQQFTSVKTLLFDYGGTLDTNGRHWSYVLWDGYKQAGVPVSEDDFREAYVYGERYLGSHDIIEATDDFQAVLLKKVRLEMARLSASGKLSFTSVAVNAAIRSIADWCNEYVLRNMQQTHQVLSALKERYALGLVSNFYGNLPAVLRAYHLSDYFSTVVESAAVGIRKPNPDIYALGLERMEAEAGQTVVIGDAFNKDILPAKQLGCKAVWFKGQTWKPEQNDEAVADAVITDLEQLTVLLL